MSNNPFGDNSYQPPTTTNFGPGKPSDPMASSKVQGPAIGLMVTGGIGIALCLFALVINVLGVGVGAAGAGVEGQGNGPQAQLMAQGVIGILQCLVGLASSGFILFAAMKMKNLESHGMAMAAAIVAMLPVLSPCCCIGLPIGIWAVVTLNDAGVKAAFK